MPKPPLLSICIPAYKRVDYLKILLDSIRKQSWKDFEVILTDDSPDSSVRELCAQYQGQFPLYYHRNMNVLGTPENWNEAIRQSKGEWIKIMHDDDWFADNDSLAGFAGAIHDYPGASFIFSTYRNVYANGKTEDVFPARARLHQLRKNSAILLAGNCIGPPSCTLYKKKEDVQFDKRFKWLVDIDFYIRYLSSAIPIYLPTVLVNIGVGDEQVTKISFRNPRVEIPENFALLRSTGEEALKSLLVFDAWWRLLRNLSIKAPSDIVEAGYRGPIPEKITTMIRAQKKIPLFLLNAGIFSKLLMTIMYIFTYKSKNYRKT